MRDLIYDTLDGEIGGIISGSCVDRLANKISVIAQDKLDEQSGDLEDIEMGLKSIVAICMIPRIANRRCKEEAEKLLKIFEKKGGD